jgi:glutamyl-tRNA synthetase/glutamyl-Q tRNA(Asp) synthetase
MRTRYAPSPTGHLHLGHVVNAIYVWGLARTVGGRVLLRMEDHDRIRCRPEYEASILEDLAWLGFEPDEGRHPLVRQSDRDRIYREALERLRRTHHVYACDCSRKRVGAEHYDGYCRTRGLQEGPGRGLRVQMDEGGDLLLRDRDGNWTYHFAVTVDDIEQGITHIIRGADLLSSTDRQLRLRRMLGNNTMPEYVHHPLILKPNGEKLSKSAADSGVRDLRHAGLTPAEVIGRAAAAVGLIDVARPIAARDVDGLFRDFRIPNPVPRQARDAPRLSRGEPRIPD